MRDNPVKARLASGGHAFGTMVFEFFTPGMAQIMAAGGAEFALFDMEHSGIGIETVKQQMSYARLQPACRWCGCRRSPIRPLHLP